MGFFDKFFGKKSTVIDTDYQNKLLATKQFYPFQSWRSAYENGLTQYTEQNCNRIQKIFDDLINDLIKLGPAAGENKKIALFKMAIEKTNQLNNEVEDLIETGEREDLCELTDQVTIACGLDPSKFGGGEGLASEWREW